MSGSNDTVTSIDKFGTFAGCLKKEERNAQYDRYSRTPKCGEVDAI